MRVGMLASLAAMAMAGGAQAQSVSGTAVFEGQTLNLSHGLAWWESKHREVKVALFDFPPGPRILADLRQGSWNTDEGPKVSVHMRFAKGGAPDRATIYYCYVNASFPRGGPMGTNTNAEGCGLLRFAGQIKARGRIAASLKNQAAVLENRPFAWDLSFDLPIAK